MKSEEHEISIQITIGDRIFPIRTTQEGAPEIEAVAQKIQDRMRKLSQTYRQRDFIDILAMLTIELAGEVQELRKTLDTQNTQYIEQLSSVLTRIQELNHSK